MTECQDPAATLAAWKAQGADQLDPVWFQFLSMLARRAATCSPDVQMLLNQRLTSLMADYRQRMQQPLHRPGQAPRPRSPLSRLLDDIRSAHPVGTGVTGAEPGFAGLKAVDWFKDSWTRLQVQQRLAQSEAAVPDKPGPLNSQRLLLQALTQLRSLSPDYLDLYLTHVDTLLWLEQAESRLTETGAGDKPATARAGGRAGGAARPVRSARRVSSRVRDGTR